MKTKFLLSLVALLFVSVLVLLYLNITRKPEIVYIPQTGNLTVPTTSPTVDPTANWKTYENKQYGFSFKYPAKYKQLISNNLICITVNEPDKDYGGCDIYVSPGNLITSAEKNIQSTLGLPTNKSLKTFANEVNWDYLEKSFGDLNWIIFHQNEGPGEGAYHNFVSSTGVIVDISVKSNLYKSDELYQILSTFKFTGTSTPIPTKTSSLVNYKTYKSDKYGISFDYPKEAKIMGDLNSQLFSIISGNQIVSFLVSNNPQNYSASDFFLKNISPSNPNSLRDYITFTDVNINNINFVLVNQDANYFSQQSSPLNGYLVKSSSYIIGFNFDKGSEPLVKQILSSLKFL